MVAYVERFEHFAEANDVPAMKKVAVFLSVIGSTTYGLLRSLLAPDKPGSKQYAATKVFRGSCKLKKH